MNKENISIAITEIKADVSKQMRRQRIAAFQRSGLGIKEWYRENGVAPSTYHKYLRKLREAYCQVNCTGTAYSDGELCHIFH